MGQRHILPCPLHVSPSEAFELDPCLGRGSAGFRACWWSSPMPGSILMPFPGQPSESHQRDAVRAEPGPARAWLRRQPKSGRGRSPEQAGGLYHKVERAHMQASPPASFPGRPSESHCSTQARPREQKSRARDGMEEKWGGGEASLQARSRLGCLCWEVNKAQGTG